LKRQNVAILHISAQRSAFIDKAAGVEKEKFKVSLQAERGNYQLDGRLRRFEG